MELLRGFGTRLVNNDKCACYPLLQKSDLCFVCIQDAILRSWGVDSCLLTEPPLEHISVDVPVVPLGVRLIREPNQYMRLSSSNVSSDERQA